MYGEAEVAGRVQKSIAFARLLMPRLVPPTKTYTRGKSYSPVLRFTRRNEHSSMSSYLLRPHFDDGIWKCLRAHFSSSPRTLR